MPIFKKEKRRPRLDLSDPCVIFEISVLVICLLIAVVLYIPNVPDIAHPYSGVIGSAISPDGKYIATGGYFTTVRIWDTIKGKEITTLNWKPKLPMILTRDIPITSLAFSPDGRKLFTISSCPSPYTPEQMMYHGASASDCQAGYQTIRVWDTKTWRPTGPYINYEKGLGIFALSPNGNYFVISGSDKNGYKLILWDALAGIRIKTFPIEQLDRIAFFTPDEKKLVIKLSREVQILDIDTGQTIRTFGSGEFWLSSAASLSSDGRYLITGRGGPNFYSETTIWDIETGKVVRHYPNMRGYIFSPDNHKIIGRNDYEPAPIGKIKIWDAWTGKLLQTLPDEKGNPFSQIMMFSPDGRYLFSAGVHDIIKKWDLETGKLVKTMKIPINHKIGTFFRRLPLVSQEMMAEFGHEPLGNSRRTDYYLRWFNFSSGRIHTIPEQRK